MYIKIQNFLISEFLFVNPNVNFMRESSCEQPSIQRLFQCYVNKVCHCKTRAAKTKHAARIRNAQVLTNVQIASAVRGSVSDSFEIHTFSVTIGLYAKFTQ